MISWQKAVFSWQREVSNGRFAKGSWQKAKSSWQREVSNGRFAKGSWQKAKSSWQELNTQKSGLR
jgi:hypothetical protein